MNTMTDFGEVSLQEILDAREMRANHQTKLIQAYQRPLLCFTMNIAGPIKNSLLIRECFLLGVRDLKMHIQGKGGKILHEEIFTERTGNTAYYVSDLSAQILKQIACEIEDRDCLGRLFDMDVLLTNGSKMSRSRFGLSDRSCLICNKEAKECSSRRAHNLEKIQEATRTILTQSFISRHSATIAALAQKALLYEVSVTPKPGLVDRRNVGSHSDMDFFSFINSSVALYTYFQEAASLGLHVFLSNASLPHVSSCTHSLCDGAFSNASSLNAFLWDTSKFSPSDYAGVFGQLRKLGRQAELRMYDATHGVNTHKGAIFTLGILSCILGMTGLHATVDEVFYTCQKLCHGLVFEDFKNLTVENAKTFGQKLYLQTGITGVRGEMEAGLPVVRKIGLPTLKKHLYEGKGFDLAGAMTLLEILIHIDDTNLISRSSLQAQKDMVQKIKSELDDIKNKCDAKKPSDERTLYNQRGMSNPEYIDEQKNISDQNMIHSQTGVSHQNTMRDQNNMSDSENIHDQKNISDQNMMVDINEALIRLDREFIERNLSPGGSADLLAACFMLYFYESM